MAVSQRGEPRVRVQVVTPRSSRKVGRNQLRRSNAARIGKALKSAAVLAKPAAVLIAVVLTVIGYNVLANSPLFELRRIEVDGAEPKLRDNVEQAVRRAVGQTKLLGVDLEAIREKVEALPRVRAASVARVLPDALYIHVVERQAVVLVRRDSGALVWLDSDAVEMGEVSDLRSEASNSQQEIPPIAKGFSEDSRSQGARAENRERIALYKQIERELSKGPNFLWKLIDEIDLTFTKDVNLRLVNPPVTVHVGSKDFYNRLETALQILGAIERGDSALLSRFRVQDPDRLIENRDHINFIDAARADRIVLNFSTPGKEKATRQEKSSDE